MGKTKNSKQSRNLLKYGMLLFLLGLLTGFVIPAMQNPRMGLSSHLEAVMNGMFLILIGLVWPKLKLSDRLFKWAYGLSIFGTFTNWLTTLFAGVFGAGSDMMPIAAEGFNGAVWQEAIIMVGLLSLSVSMIVVSVLVLMGLKDSEAETL